MRTIGKITVAVLLLALLFVGLSFIRARANNRSLLEEWNSWVLVSQEERVGEVIEDLGENEDVVVNVEG